MLSSKPEQRDQTTTPGTTFPTLRERCVEDAGDRAYDFSSLSEKTRMSNHLQM